MGAIKEIVEFSKEVAAIPADTVKVATDKTLEQWQKIDESDESALTKVFKKAVNVLLAGQGPGPAAPKSPKSPSL